ncbi:hypothetical protein ACRALDRAFT_2018325 [Sodiomyces alcalophilus JCM 7366]|uniref:uncharacterized protein n=1 Tax=Sodiomyces alcalophilus JCM 7366 TaxID=591952 RepID=UPI0039B4BD56
MDWEFSSILRWFSQNLNPQCRLARHLSWNWITDDMARIVKMLPVLAKRQACREMQVLVFMFLHDLPTFCQLKQ